MKKTNLTRKLLAACSIVALSAVMYGCVHGGDDPAPIDETDMEMPEPMPEPGPTDLEETQTAAADAAAAAMTASDAAAKAADDAATATMYLATLQTGDDSNSDAMGGREAATAASDAAGEAADAASAAADASAAAAAATTGDDGEAAWRMAVAAQEAAEAAQMDAETASAAAVEAAMTELHINGTVKTVGESSVDADADASDSPPVPDTAQVFTGFRYYVTRATPAVEGEEFVHTTVRDDDQAYVQAVEGRRVQIGKTLDTADDAARLRVIHSRVGSKKVSVYVEDGTENMGFVIRTDSAGKKTQGANAVAIDEAEAAGALNPLDGPPRARALKSLGMYYEAADIHPDGDGIYEVDADGELVVTTTDTEPGTTTVGDHVNNLDHDDRIGAKTKGKEVLSYPGIDLGSDTALGGTGDAADTPITRYVVESMRTVNSETGDTDVTYQHVDVTAVAGPDISRDAEDPGDTHEQIQVKATIAEAKAYDHIHFGVWAALEEAEKDVPQELAGLGIGFVQSVGDGVTDRLGIGTVTYKGDWVAVIQRKNSAAEGTFGMDGDAATMTADFDMEEFEADLKGLAMLEGTLDGNGFSGMKATQISHDDLDGSGDFEGEFSGNIYGAKGTEAAGVFDFAGGEAGSFRGAFGGTNQK